MLAAGSSETTCEPTGCFRIAGPDRSSGGHGRPGPGDRPARNVATSADLSSGRLPLGLNLLVILVQVNVVVHLRDP